MVSYVTLVAMYNKKMNYWRQRIELTVLLNQGLKFKNSHLIYLLKKLKAKS